MIYDVLLRYSQFENRIDKFRDINYAVKGYAKQTLNLSIIYLAAVRFRLLPL